MKMTDLKSMTEEAKANRLVRKRDLEYQLTHNSKPNRGTTGMLITKTKDKKARPRIELTTKDIVRIKKEIKVLKTRI